MTEKIVTCPGCGKHNPETTFSLIGDMMKCDTCCHEFQVPLVFDKCFGDPDAKYEGQVGDYARYTFPNVRQPFPTSLPPGGHD